MPDKPNILLVHGAWGDASHWRHVIPPLHEKGYRVFAVQNPLTSLSDDIDRTSKLAAAQNAPTLLVGYAYGCAVITGAGLMPNVVGLVYLAGPALDEGESLKSLWARRAPPEGAANIRQDKYGFLWIEPEKFHETFCHDLEDTTESLVWALTQKPTAVRCFEEKSGAPAWKVKPSWYQIALFGLRRNQPVVGPVVPCPDLRETVRREHSNWLRWARRADKAALPGLKKLTKAQKRRLFKRKPEFEGQPRFEGGTQLSQGGLPTLGKRR